MKKTKHRRKVSPLHNPVGLAFAKQTLVSSARDIKIELYLRDDGDDCTGMLANLAILIGTACSAGAAIEDRPAWVRQLHGALRTVQHLCMAGYKWQPEYAHAFSRALEIAESKVMTLPVDALFKALHEAHWFSDRIERHVIDGQEIAA